MYLNDWKEGQLIQMLQDFKIITSDGKIGYPIILEQLKKSEILLASYDRAEYSGDAYILIKKNNKLYEINADHCSCFGLETQWEPEETTLDSIKYRLKEGELGIYDEKNIFAKELIQVINSIEFSQ